MLHFADIEARLSANDGGVVVGVGVVDIATTTTTTAAMSALFPMMTMSLMMMISRR